MTDSFWEVGSGLPTQGEYIQNCAVPLVGNDFGEADEVDIRIIYVDLIVLTQSCDIENGKAPLVASCPLYPISTYEKVNPKIAKEWDKVRKGQYEGLHLLGSPENPGNNREALVVVFREIYSLPIDYLRHQVKQPSVRWRLRSPYLEHFSQAFARFFMRVGLPSSIPPFK